VLRHRSIDTMPAGGSIENGLAAVWAEILEVDSVGVHDDFFALGGNSLLAMQIAARSVDTFGVRIGPDAVFQAPTIAEFAKTVAAADQAATPRPARRRDRRGGRTPSQLQEGLWLDCSRHAWYRPHVGDALLLSGPLDIDALERALTEVVRRHEILRTVFPASGYRVSVSVLAPEAIPIPSVDLTGMGASQQRFEVRRLVQQTWADALDIRTMSPLRTKLLKLGPVSNVLVVVAHELVCDGWSIEVLIHELSEIYNSFRDDPPPEPSHPAPQYFDIVNSQSRDRHAGSVRLDQKFVDKPLTFAYPFESGGFPMSSEQSRTQETTQLPDDLTGRLYMIAQRESATPFMLYLTAFFVLLHKCTRETDVLISIYTSGRPTVELENVLGYFARRIPLHIPLDDTRSFSTVLSQTRESVLEILAYADMAITTPDLLPLAVDGVRGLRASSILFRHFDRVHDRPLRFSGMSVERILTPGEGGHLTMHVSERPRQQTSVKLSSDWLDAAILKRLLACHRRLLESIADKPDESIRALELLSGAERRRLVVEWGKVSSESKSEQCLHQLVELQARRTPDAIAVNSTQGEISYRELDERASELADHLHAQGVGRSELVGVAIPPSAEMLVAMLGVLKVGGTCMPIDVDGDRTSIDIPAASRVLIVNGSMSSLEFDAGIVIDLAAMPVKSDGSPDRRGEQLAEVEDLDRAALVIQTAGVTNPAKLVSLTHRAMVHVAIGHRRAYALKESDRGFHFPGQGALTWALAPWSYLAAGAEVLSPEDSSRRSSSQMADWLRARGATIVTLPTALASSLLSSEPAERSSLRAVVAHGYGALIDQANVAVFRQYAMAEAGGFAMAAPVEDATDAIIVGSSSNSCTKAYVLGPELKPMPPDEVGELYLGGVGLAQGYVGRPDASADVFMPDPFTEAPRARMVKTGDLARWRANGRIELCGRLQDEVRFRGFRLNAKMHQLESALTRNPAVAAAATRWDETGELLVAYVVPCDDVSLSARALNRWVQRVMPGWILPAHYVALDHIPLRHDGAPDHRALAETAGRRLDVENGRDAARAPLERKLVSIWRKVLKRRRVGTNDNFFRIGGDMILGHEMAVRARSAGLSVTMQNLMECPTIAELAAAVDEQ
jgi:non-ribosomal peptide synthetase component F/aryl carrier-like protein